MIQLAYKDIPAEVKKILTDLQQKINDEATFEEKAAKAQALWNTKGGKKGKAAFNTIKNLLLDMCVYKGVCNYCEQNESNDIEHIYPKSFFPEFTFDWANYLLACKQCNSAYKLDRCHVLDDDHQVVDVPRGTEPLYKIIAFINPRQEHDNPNDYMLLNMLTGQFMLLPGLTPLQANKAQKTLDILQLNNRDTLIASRKSAGIYYYQRLELLADILEAKDVAEIERMITPYDAVLDLEQPLDSIKKYLFESFRDHIQTYLHPSVWFSIKTIDSRSNTKWKKLFQRVPQALSW